MLVWGRNRAQAERGASQETTVAKLLLAAPQVFVPFRARTLALGVGGHWMAAGAG